MRNPYPFYIEHPRFSETLRDLADAIKMMEELKKGGTPPPDIKKPSAFKTWLLLCIGSFALFPFFVWVWTIIFMDIIQKAKHFPL